MKALLVPLCLLMAGQLMANPVLKTVAGGPSQLNSHFYGYADGVTATVAQFDYPCGLALDPSGNLLFIADCTNNAVRVISSLNSLGTSITSTFANATNGGLYRPVAVAVDGATNVYVLNRGTGSNGTLLKFNGSYYNAYGFAFLVSTNASGLINPTALAMDALTNLYVTHNNNTVLRISPAGVSTVVGVIPNAGVSLHGVTVMDNGLLALTDAGNNGIWLLNPVTGAASVLTGFHGAGDVIGPPGMAAFNHPEMIAQAAGNLLIVADRGNHKVKAIDSLGDVTRLYGVSSNYWVKSQPSEGIYAGWADGTICSIDELGCPEAREPVGVAVASDGSVYTTEVYYHLVRHTSTTGFTGPVAGSSPLFNAPAGIALDPTFTSMFVADTANNAVELLNLNLNVTTSFLGAAQGIVQPVDIVVDTFQNVYVLNRGSGANGSILEFDKFGNLLATKASGLVSPSAFTVDNSGHLYVASQGGSVQQFGAGQARTIATVSGGAGVQLQGIALFDDGVIAVSDSANDVLWQVNPVTGAASLLTGAIGTPGSTLGSATYARLNQPQRLARALGNLLVVADSGNNRLVVVDRTGSVTNALVSTNSSLWFGRPGDPHGPTDSLYVPMASPVGVAVGNGLVYDSEPGIQALRGLAVAGVINPGPGGGGGTGTNMVVLPPVIDPASESGYYPMGRYITVSSLSSNVCYTTDGSTPTLQSAQVAMNGTTGVIPWFNLTNDVTGLQVVAFIGTNASVVVGGQAPSANTIGIPAPSTAGVVYAGIGSTIVLPIVVDLLPGAQVKSYQFRVEVAANDAMSPAIGTGFQTLPVGANDFLPLVTAAQGNAALNLPGTFYSDGAASGLAISTANNGAFSFQRFAVVGMLSVQIPASASQGNSYSLVVTNPSATSDGVSANVPLSPLPPITIEVTNLPYMVGDSASPAGGWYSAGEFGDSNLDNADVNNAFYAAAGLRVPYAFTDVYNAMDAYPPDADGFVGGDGQIRFLDWQVILQRSLRLDTNNWDRAWSAGGVLTNFTVAFQPQPQLRVAKPMVQAPWYRQALVGAVSVGQAVPGAAVSVPVYVKMTDGVTLSGLQFRAVITPANGAPALGQAPQFTPQTGLAAPSLAQAFQPGEAAFGWSLGSFNFTSSSSNYLGLITFTIPNTAQAGQVYAVALANADGAPNLQTQFDLETRSASVTVGGPATPASVCSDDWKLYFFGSLTDPRAVDSADPDGDGMPNWMEFLAGTSPLDANSKLQFNSAEQTVVNGQDQTVVHWLTAPGRAYELLRSAKPSGGPWTSLANISGDGTVANCADTNAPAAACYYRLRLLP